MSKKIEPYFKGQKVSSHCGHYYPDFLGVAFRPLDKNRFVRIAYCLECREYSSFIAKYKNYDELVKTELHEQEPSIEHLELTRTDVLDKWKKEKKVKS